MCNLICWITTLGGEIWNIPHHGESAQGGSRCFEIFSPKITETVPVRDILTGRMDTKNPNLNSMKIGHQVLCVCCAEKRGKTPVLKADEARLLLDSIKIDSIVGLRDRALLGIMCYTFARVSAVVHMKTDDYYQQGKRWWIRLHEKGGKRHEVPAHHNAEAYIDGYLDAARIREEKKSPLFRSVDVHRKITENAMTRTDVFRMIKRRAVAAGLPSSTCCHTFRATGITAYLENGGTIENAQAIAAHESPRTTKLYDRTGDEITLDEVERIVI